MKNRLSKLLFTLIFLGASALVTYAGLHVVGGVGFNNGSLEVTATVVGFGNNTVHFTAYASGQVTGLCQNRGGNVAPGQNVVNVSQSVSGTTQTDDNGRATITAIIPLQDNISKRAAGCPNGNWTVIDLDGSANVGLQFSAGSQNYYQVYACNLTFDADSCYFVEEGNGTLPSHYGFGN